MYPVMFLIYWNDLLHSTTIEQFPTYVIAETAIAALGENLRGGTIGAAFIRGVPLYPGSQHVKANNPPTHF